MRLTKIYTKTGDQGETHFANERLAKNDQRIELIGSLDELNSALGVVLANPLPDDIEEILTQIQHELFDLGGELHVPDHPKITPQHISNLETKIDELNKTLAPLKEFILPRGNMSTATCHLARAICRRCERVMVAAHKQFPLKNTECVRYLNRLSDLLFVVARVLNESEEVLWENNQGI